MTHIAKIILAAAALAASTMTATAGAKVTAMGYGNTKTHAKMVTIQTWTKAAYDAYGFADWNTAYIGYMECHPNSVQQGAASGFSTMQREVIRTGGDSSADWSCIVSGFQDS